MNRMTLDTTLLRFEVARSVFLKNAMFTAFKTVLGNGLGVQNPDVYSVMSIRLCGNREAGK